VNCDRCRTSLDGRHSLVLALLARIAHDETPRTDDARTCPDCLTAEEVEQLDRWQAGCLNAYGHSDLILHIRGLVALADEEIASARRPTERWMH